MKIRSLFLGAAAAAAALTASAGTASAYVVCNRHGDCWHVERHYERPGLRFTYHPDDWYFHRRWDRDRRWRWHAEHEGRGYWRGGVWITF